MSANEAATPLTADSPPSPATVRAGGKSVTAFRTISEVSGELDVPQHVLRFWETKFSQLRPLKRAGGRRYYRPEDVALLRRIHGLLYKEGYTIKGVQRVLRAMRKDEDATCSDIAPATEPQIPGIARQDEDAAALLRAVLIELKTLRANLD
jgi:DNA-binding transcriptional MerR regulator